MAVYDTSQLSDEEMLAQEFVAPEPNKEEPAAETPAAEVVEPAVVVEATAVEEPADEPEQEEVNPLSDDELLANKPKEVSTEAKPVEPEKKEESSSTGSTDYKAFHDQMMAPFKANGKTIELRTPEEAIQLMKMGANYTRKMQDMAVFKKHLTMLENNGLLDEDKLSFLIDLDKKNPEAIKKLIKEAGIDPMDIDTNAPIAYQQGNHRVSDTEVKFRTVLEAVSATSEGKETVQAIHTGWDQASKDALWASPEVMEVIHEQRQNGIYQQVASEVERQIALGTIRPGTPFLEAYKTVGQFMGQNGLLKNVPQGQNSSQQLAMPVAPLATKAATIKPTVTNTRQVAAAAPTRTGGKRTPSVTNLAGLNDDEFIKTFAGRL